MPRINQSVTLLIILLFMVLVKIPMLSAPAFWDEPTYTENIIYGDLSDFFNSESSYSGKDHIPGYALVLKTLSIKGSNTSLIILRSFHLLLACLGVLLVFRILKGYFPENDSSLGLLLFAFALSPLYFAYMTIILPNLAVCTLALLSLALYRKLRNQSLALLLLVSHCVFETSIAFTLPIVALKTWEARNNKELRKGLIWLYLSYLPIAVFMLKNLVTSGKVFYHTAVEERLAHGFSWGELSSKTHYLERMLAFALHNCGYFIAALGILIWKRFFNRDLFVIALSTLLYVGFFFLYGDYHARNLFTPYALVFLALAISISLLKKQSARFTISALFLGLVVGVNFFPLEEESPDTNAFVYQDAIKVMSHLKKDLEAKGIKDINTHWPVSSHLMEKSSFALDTMNTRIYPIYENKFNEAAYTVLVDFYPGNEFIPEDNERLLMMALEANASLDEKFTSRYLRYRIYRPRILE